MNTNTDRPIFTFCYANMFVLFLVSPLIITMLNELKILQFDQIYIFPLDNVCKVELQVNKLPEATLLQLNDLNILSSFNISLSSEYWREISLNVKNVW